MSNRLSPMTPLGKKTLLAATVLVVLTVLTILPLAAVWGADPPVRASINQEGRDCSQSGSPPFYTQFMVENRAPWTQIVPIPSRDLVANNFVVTSISFADSQPDQSQGPVTVSYTLTVGGGVATWVVTASTGWTSPRWNPIVLPGETTAVLYLGWVCDSTANLGMHRVQVTISGTFQGQPLDLKTEYTYRVTP